MNMAAPETFAQLLQQRARTQGDFPFLTFVDESTGQPVLVSYLNKPEASAEKTEGGCFRKTPGAIPA